MNGVRAVVFDLDDTLYPERDYAFSGFDAVAATFQEELGPADQIAARMRALFDTPERGRIFNTLIEDCGLPRSGELIDSMIAAYRSHTPRIALHPDADAALLRLHPRYKLGLITDGYSVTQYAKIDALNLGPRLEAVIITDDWGREFWKPHPRAFEEMSRRLDVPPEACIYVADNPAKDFIAPNALGWQTVFIKRADGVHSNNPPVAGGTARAIIDTLDALG